MPRWNRTISCRVFPGTGWWNADELKVLLGKWYLVICAFNHWQILHLYSCPPLIYVCAHLSSSCLGPVSWVFVISFFFFSSSSVFGQIFIEWHVQAHPTEIVCLNFSPPCNYVIFCSGFPLNWRSSLADRGLRKQWVNFSSRSVSSTSCHPPVIAIRLASAWNIKLTHLLLQILVVMWKDEGRPSFSTKQLKSD